MYKNCAGFNSIAIMNFMATVRILPLYKTRSTFYVTEGPFMHLTVCCQFLICCVMQVYCPGGEVGGGGLTGW